MALNHILHVRKIYDEYARGLPEGLDDEFLHNLRFLFDRIRELEGALRPFTRAAEVNESHPTELVSVHLTDCQKARDMLDVRRSRPLPPKTIYYPAG